MILDVGDFNERKFKLAKTLATSIPAIKNDVEEQSKLGELLLLAEDHYFSNTDIAGLRPTLINVLSRGTIESVFEFILVTSEYIYYSGDGSYSNDEYLRSLATNYLVTKLPDFTNVSEMVKAMVVSTFPYMLDFYIYKNGIDITEKTDSELISSFFDGYREVQFFDADLKQAIIDNCLAYLDRIRPTEPEQA